MARAERARVAGPLAAFAEGFGAELGRLGYSRFTADAQLQFMAHVSGWLGDHGLGAQQLTASRVEEYLVSGARAGMFTGSRRARWCRCWRICAGWGSRRPPRRRRR